MMKKKPLAATITGLMAASISTGAMAVEGPVPRGIPALDHVFVIMMENHSFDQVVGNPAMPFINDLIANKRVNLATSYFAVGHPSLTNYLEIVGGSNFGIRSDNSPDWHNLACSPNLATGLTNADDDSGPAAVPSDVTLDPSSVVCPISGTGTEALTPAVDTWNETNPPVFNYLANIDGVRSVPTGVPIDGKTIGDQLAAVGKTWKTYQENLPVTGADLINTSNGTATNLTTFNSSDPLSATNLPPLTSGSLLSAYAVKHNPFAYFRSVQEGTGDNSLHSMVGFEGPRGLYADLATGRVPNFSYIVPNQCDDQHGRGNGDAFCQYDQGVSVTIGGTSYTGNTFGTQAGLNPGLSAQADNTLRRLVTGIKSSPAWREGRNAIVVVWDENDYSGTATALPAGTVFPAPNQNNVVLTVETNHGAHGVQSGKYYDSFSLLRSIEGGLRLPCLNHACDAGVEAMSDLFGG